jgi:hypothetical protein
MSDVPRPVPSRRYRLLTFAAALAAGFLGANAFADAAGLPHVSSGERHLSDSDIGAIFLRILCGLVVGVLVLALIPFVVNQCREVAAVLGRTSERPGPAVAITLVICGTLCLLGSLALAWHAASLAQAPSIQVQAPGMPGFPGSVSGSASVQVSTQPPLLTQVLALLTFLAGSALISLGIWSSIKPTGTRATALTPPPLEGVMAAGNRPFPDQPA